jgi:hypothetical protein
VQTRGLRTINCSVCSGINKPVAVRDWLNKTQPQEDYIMVIDSDTIMRVPFDVDQLGIKPGKDLSLSSHVPPYLPPPLPMPFRGPAACFPPVSSEAYVT